MLFERTFSYLFSKLSQFLSKLTKVPKGHPCGNLYGLAFKLEVHIEGNVDTDTGFVIDFNDLERQYIQNKLSGYNNKEIYIRLGEISPHQLRIQVKEKLRRYYAEETQENSDI